MVKPAIEEALQRVPGITIPYAIAAPIVAVMIAIFGYTFRLDARVTQLETIASSPSKYDAQFAQIATKLEDFQRLYERDRINDQVAAARNSK